MARGKPRSEWTPAYRRRIERGERLGRSRAESRGHPEESKTGVGASVFNRIEDAAETAVSSQLISGPFGPNGSWTTVYIAVDEQGNDTIIDITQGRKMKDADRDKLKARVRDHLKGRNLPPPTVGTP